MGVWKLIIEICLPIPLTLIIALLCPAPRQVSFAELDPAWELPAAGSLYVSTLPRLKV